MSRKPNILMIMTDAHSPRIAGFAGDPDARTENLDRLAAGGTVFDNAFCANPVCTPSRMSMMCSKEAHRCAAWSNHWIIFPEHVTWPGHFADHGYRTCLVGKMHYGGGNQMNGFQHRPYGDLRHGLGHQPDPLHMYPGYAHVESAGITEVPESLTQDVVVSREALSFVLEHHDAQPETPWFVCASFGRPHSPLTAPGRYIRRYWEKLPPDKTETAAKSELEPFAGRYFQDLTPEENQHARAGYYACVDFVDDCIGELLTGLEAGGCLDNTIVIYTADHGEMLGSHGCWGKQIYYDPSMGVPLLMSGPGIPEGSRLPQIVSLMDLFPTTCSLAGLPVPDGLDGVDFSGILSGGAAGTTESADAAHAPKAPREYAPSAYYAYGVRINFNTRSEEEPHGAWRVVRTQEWKYVEVEGGSSLLFDLAGDPDERVNLAGQEHQKARCSNMRKMLFHDFSWEEVHRQLAADRARVPEFLSGNMPGTPNQYMLPDGRVFDAEGGLYGARWLAIPQGTTGGIIPQMFG